MHQIEIH